MWKKRRTNKRGMRITLFIGDLPPEIQGYLKKLTKVNQQSQFVKDAIRHWYFRTFKFKRYLREVITLNFGLVRHILRKVGREKSCLNNKKR